MPTKQQSYFQSFTVKHIHQCIVHTEKNIFSRLASQIILSCQKIFEWVQSRYSVTDMIVQICFRPTQYKVPLRMAEFCPEPLMSCLTALRENITLEWILSQGSARMLQDSQMTRNTGRIITRPLYFHLLIKRCVLIATFYHFPFMGLFSVLSSSFSVCEE